MTKTLAFIDVETTGLNSALHEIIEISIMKVYPNGKEEIYTTKVSPELIEHASPEALEINGYNHSDWLGAPSADAIFPSIAEMLTGCILVGHNVRFDEEFLSETLHRLGLRAKYDRRLIDTITLAHEHLCLPSLSMDAIRDYFGWTKIGAHRAERDVIDCRRLYCKLLRCSWFSRLIWKLQYRLRSAIRRG